jgi:hypothetical protein
MNWRAIFGGAYGTDTLERRANSATASFSMTLFKCAVTSLCRFTGMVDNRTGSHRERELLSS